MHPHLWGSFVWNPKGRLRGGYQKPCFVTPSRFVITFYCFVAK